jgi:hypothetical protein
LFVDEGRCTVRFTSEPEGEVKDFDFTVLPVSRELQVAFARAFHEHVGPAGQIKALGAAAGSFGHLRSFCASLAESPAPPATPGELRPRHLDEFLLRRASLATAGMSLGVVRALLVNVDGLTPAFVAKCAAWVPHRRERIKSRGSYSPGEEKRILAAARETLRAAARRIRSNQELLARWRAADPALLGNTRRNEFCQVLDLVDRTGDLPRYPGDGNVRDWVSRHGTVDELLHTLHLRWQEVAAFIIVLVRLTGQNGSTIATAPAAHHRPDGGVSPIRTVQVDLQKPRRGRRRYLTAALSDLPSWASTPREEGELSGRDELHTSFGVYRLACELTASARTITGSPRLLIYAVHKGTGGRSFRDTPSKTLTGAWGQELHLVADPAGPGPVQRLIVSAGRMRVTHAAREQKPVAHTTSTLATTYLRRDRSTLREYQKLVADVLAAEVDKARAVGIIPQLTAADLAEAHRDPATVAARFRVTEDTLSLLISRYADTVLAGCTDHLNSPHSPAGQPCRASFLKCLDCPCARAMPHHLPLQIVARDLLQERRTQLSALRWAQRFAFPFAQLDDLLDQAGPTAIDRPARGHRHRPRHGHPTAEPGARPAMTQTTTAAPLNAAERPGPDAPVLQNRLLRPGTQPSQLSCFGDDRWNLTPAIFEGHLTAVSLNFALIPAAFREIAKHYAWLELNHEDLLILRRASINGRLAVYTMLSHLRNIRVFLDWLNLHGITSLDAVTETVLQRYLDHVRDAEIRRGARSDLLQAVRRLWAFRDLLPADARLPEAPPWNGKDTRILLGRPQRNRENRTPRIPEATMSMILSWALRMIDDFSGDILAALDEFRPLFGRLNRRTTAPGQTRTARVQWLTERLEALLADFHTRGVPLPGVVMSDGTRQPDWAYLGRLLDCNYQLLERDGPRRRAILASGLPITDAAYLETRPTGLLDGQPWLQQIRYDQVPALARVLNAASFIVTAYLSGARPGEVLNVERGCVSHDPGSGLWEMHGRKWKNATDDNGVKIPEGQHRDDPWIVVEPVARAVAVVEALHDAPLLFPVAILDHRSTDRAGARNYASINEDLNVFVDWVNSYCQQHGRTDIIPTTGTKLKASQFRRTLAWFICRRPRGLVAAAIQYGHLNVRITQGYAGTYASGFPDDLAFERWLARLDELADADRRLRDGEHISGPAADAYRCRVAGGAARFAGRVIRNGRQARTVLANPSLQIHPGKAMTCVFNAATALCELLPSTDDAHHTPDADDCRPACRNIARTDANIAAIRAETTELRAVVDDTASPPIRHARERARLDYLEKVIAEHEATRPAKTQP